MADAQIAIIDGDQTQVVLAPGENPAIVSSIPGPQGPAGAGVPLGGTTNQVLFKQSGTNYDTAWGPITSAMIGDLEIVNADVSASAAIAGTKISPNFGSQNVTTTGTSTAASFIPSSSTVPTNGLYLSAANSVALSTNGTGRLFVDASGRVGVGTQSPAAPLTVAEQGVGGAPIFRFVGNATNGNFMRGGWYASDNTTQLARINVDGTSSMSLGTVSSTPLAILTDNTERLRITSAGLVGIGSSAPYVFTQIEGQLMATGSADQFASEQKVLIFGRKGRSSLDRHNYISSVVNFTTGNDNKLLFYVDDSSGTSHVNPLTLTGANRVGIGTQSPSTTLHVVGTGRVQAADGATIDFSPQSDTNTVQINRSNARFLFNGTGTAKILKVGATGSLQIESSTSLELFAGGSTERARIDSSGRLLVGTSSARSNFNNSAETSPLQIEGTSANTAGAAFIHSGANTFPAVLQFAKQRSGTIGGNTIVQAEDNAGFISFEGSDGSEFVRCAAIGAVIDGTPGANDMPGRLVFSTTADGASSPTERFRITSAGVLQVADAGNIAVGTTTGTKIGTATTQKLGFYNATPVVQPAAVADATDAATVITQLNDLLAKLRTLGIIAT